MPRTTAQGPRHPGDDPQDYARAKRTTFTAFYTMCRSPISGSTSTGRASLSMTSSWRNPWAPWGLGGVLALVTSHYMLDQQNEGWLEVYRQQARIAFNRVYNSFVATYDPINKMPLA